jgi:hypothetical protein
MELIEQITLGSATSTVSITAIPDGFTDLLLLCSIRTNRTGASGFIRPFINSSTSNQTVRRLFGNGSSASSTTETNNWGFIVPSANNTANTFGNTSIYMPNYRSSANKSFSIDSVEENNATASNQVITAGIWTDTNAITSIQIVDPDSTMAIGSSFSLFGILAGSDGIVAVS